MISLDLSLAIRNILVFIFPTSVNLHQMTLHTPNEMPNRMPFTSHYELILLSVLKDLLAVIISLSRSSLI